MDVYALDRNMDMLGRLDFINLQWNRKYYEVGDFEIYMTADQYDPATRFIVTDERTELGIVYKVHGTKNVSGDFVTLSGYFSEKIYDYTLSWPALFDIYGADHQVKLKNLITTGIVVDGEQDPPLMLLHTDYHGLAPDHKGDGGMGGKVYDIRPGTCARPNTDIKLDWEYKSQGEGLREALKALGMAYRLRFDIDRKCEYVDIWQGADRTEGNTKGNEPAVFSDESPSVLTFDYEHDESDFRDIVVTHYGSDDDGEYYRHDGYRHAADGVSGLFDGDEYEALNRTMAFDCRRWGGIKFAGQRVDGEHPPEIDDEERAELNKHNIIEKADLTVAQEDGFRYMEDYDLGDKCTIVSHRFGVTFEQRITEVHEVWLENRHEVTIVFGEQSRTVYRRAKDYVETDRRMTRFLPGNTPEVKALWQAIFEEEL